MLALHELGEVTLLATPHHHFSKVHTREAYLRWKVQFDAEMDCITDAFQLIWAHADFDVFLCSVHEQKHAANNQAYIGTVGSNV